VATISELQARVHGVYSEIANNWYADRDNWKPATVKVEISSDHSAYSHEKNLILIRVEQGNLEAANVLDRPDIFDERRWPIWMPFLIHEMLHEYEKKVISAPTDAGIELHSKYPHPMWDPADHGPRFYGAICDRAPYFNLSPRQLLGAV
jgi:hypothetical protein